ncbi:hypothetical protein ACGK9R_08385 [Halomonas sp. HNIBRBA4712]|uniref:hypothetical protein n=1 Tax=Halomonas sp. HNIBRBA4712 TaxID=3373087 RepID=UPI0037451F7B
MHRLQLENISEAGLKLAIQEIRSEMFDTPHTDYTIAKMLSHCSHFDVAERYLDEMLLKWGSSPDVVELINEGYAMVDTMSATSWAQKQALSQPAMRHAAVEVEAAIA